MFLGGGVLNSGCVQEEIRFMICPELLVSMLFTQVLNKNETVLIKGCERFSSYTGYASTFKFSNDYVDETARDGWLRMHTEVLAMDAIYFRNPKIQFEESKIVRELNKSYSGFKYSAAELNNEQLELIIKNNNFPCISTGNWGCGAFNGDRQLKCIILFYIIINEIY